MPDQDDADGRVGKPPDSGLADLLTALTGVAIGTTAGVLRRLTSLPLRAARVPFRVAALPVEVARASLAALQRGLEQPRDDEPAKPRPERASPPPPSRARPVVAAAAAPPEEPPAPDELPLDDFDHIALGALPTRLRRLALPDLLMLRDYELAHARRAGVLTMLENRIAKVELRRDAAPSD